MRLHDVPVAGGSVALWLPQPRQLRKKLRGQRRLGPQAHVTFVPLTPPAAATVARLLKDPEFTAGFVASAGLPSLASIWQMWAGTVDEFRGLEA